VMSTRSTVSRSGHRVRTLYPSQSALFDGPWPLTPLA
jgi:hypothetical protein